MDVKISTAKIFSSSITNAALRFIGLTLFARLLNPTELGIYFLFFALLSLLAIPADLGIRGAIEKRISEGNNQSSLLTTGIVLKLIFLVPITLSLFILSSKVNSYIGKQLTAHLIVALVMQELAWAFIMAIRGELRVGKTALLQVSRQATWLLAGLVFVDQGLGATSLVYGLILGYTIMLIFSYWRSNTNLGYPRYEDAKSLIKYARFDAISFAGWKLFSWIDVLILGLFVSSSKIGAYEVAWQITVGVVLASNAISTTILPKFSSWHKDDLISRIEETLPITLLFSLYLVIPSFFGAMVFSEEILGIIFGNKYEAAWLVLIILMSQKVLHAVYVIIERAIKSIDRPALAGKATGIGILTNIVLNLLLVPQIGIVGASLATTGSFSLSAVLIFYYSKRHLKINIPYVEVSWLVASALVMSVVIYIIKHNIRVNDEVLLISAIGLGALIYTSMSVIHPSIRSYVHTGYNELVNIPAKQ